MPVGFIASLFVCGTADAAAKAKAVVGLWQHTLFYSYWRRFGLLRALVREATSPSQPTYKRRRAGVVSPRPSL